MLAQPNLDRRVTIQSASTAADAAGQPIETWSDFAADVPAEYLPVSGSEQFEAQQQLARAVARFRVRHRADLTRRMRLVFEGGNWNIRHLEEDRRYGRRQYLVITAELVGAT